MLSKDAKQIQPVCDITVTTSAIQKHITNKGNARGNRQPNHQQVTDIWVSGRTMWALAIMNNTRLAPGTVVELDPLAAFRAAVSL